MAGTALRVTCRLRRGWAAQVGFRLTYRLGPLIGWRPACLFGDLWCRLAAIEYSTDGGRRWRRHGRLSLTFDSDVTPEAEA